MDVNALQRHVGLRLKALRLAKKLKQEDLEQWGFSYRYYGKMERGLVNPTLETLDRLCKIFEIELPDLFVFIESENIVSEEGEAVAAKVASLLKEGNSKKIYKLKIFLDEIL